MNATPQEPSSAKQILVVEDDEDMRKLVQDILTQAGYLVLEASKATDAMVQMEKWQIDLLVLDIHMPGASGVDLLKVMRRRGQNIPTVVISGFLHEDLAKQIADLGVYSILAKPFTHDRLAGEVGKLLQPNAPPTDL